MNLKQAAARLGIHYQTAYKLVRSGRLIAVRVGSRYEVSEAAIERFRAERDRLARLAAAAGETAVDAGPGRTGDQSPGAALAVLTAVVDATTASARGACDEAVRLLTRTLSDAAWVRLLDDRGRLAAVSFTHRDPTRVPVLAALFDIPPQEVGTGVSGGVVACGQRVVWPIVPIDEIERRVEPERRHGADLIGLHSLIAIPIVVAGTTVGTVCASRGAPGNPFVPDDVEVVERVAAMLGVAVTRARTYTQGSLRCRSLAAALSGGPVPAPGRCDTDRLDTLLDVSACEAVLTASGGVASSAWLDRFGTVTGWHDLVRITAGTERQAEQDVLERIRTGVEARRDGTRRVVEADGGEAAVALHRGAVTDRTGSVVAIVVLVRDLPQVVRAARADAPAARDAWSSGPSVARPAAGSGAVGRTRPQGPRVLSPRS